MKKVIVTGGGGSIGSSLCMKLLEEGVEVIAACRADKKSKIPDGVRFAEFDMNNFSMLKETVRDRDIDVMYHMAWNGSSGESRGNYPLQLENAKFTCDAVKVAAEMGIRRFVGAGSLAEFDCISYSGNDGSTPNLTSCYAGAKIAAHFMSKALANSLGVEHVWCFISNTYGAGVSANFVCSSLEKMIRGEKASFTAGEQNYDFVHISDTVNGLFLCGDKGRSGFSYYIGSGKPRKLKEFINLMRNAVNPSLKIGLGEIPFNGISHPPETYDCTKIQRDTGYRAQVDFESGIAQTVKWLRGKK